MPVLRRNGVCKHKKAPRNPLKSQLSAEFVADKTVIKR